MTISAPAAPVADVLVPAVARLIEVFGGPPLLLPNPRLTADLALGAGWAVDLAVAEHVIRRRRTGASS